MSYALLIFEKTWSTGLRWSFFVFAKYIKDKKIFYFISLDISPLDFSLTNQAFNLTNGR